MAAALPTENHRLEPAVEAGKLLPNPAERSALTWDQVKLLVPTVVEPKPKTPPDLIDGLLKIRNKHHFDVLSIELWPARTKTDLRLRRTRLYDYVLHARRTHSVGQLRHVLGLMPDGSDIIFVHNIVSWSYCAGLEVVDRWAWLGAFDSDVTHYISVAKKVHDLGKTVGLADEHWPAYVESATMAGYRNPPFPGFDFKKEAAALAQGGDRHNYFGRSWSGLCTRYLHMPYKQVPFRTFREFVVSGDWLTAGASDVGRLRVTLDDGSELDIKARKNMVADVVDLEELATAAWDNARSINYAIIKSELGKLRIAVAGDLYCYLQETWVLELLGGTYAEWPGSTMDESFTEQTERMFEMLKLTAVEFSLPYDFAGFDHQPTTDEVKGIVREILLAARLNVPLTHRADFDQLSARVLAGYDKSVIVVREQGSTTSFDVEGGLPSGRRLTSVVGNGWNTVIRGLVGEVLTEWGVDSRAIKTWVRGDDSAIFTKNWATAAATNLAYSAVGAKAGEGKFSIRDNGTEFLRIWYDTQCRGYPARAAPGLVQRKPWSNEPWSDDAVIRAVYGTITTLRRRLPWRQVELNQLWVTLRHVWCRSHNLPDLALEAPVELGGLGIVPPAAGYHVTMSPAIPRASNLRPFRVTNQTDWRARKLTSRALDEYSIQLPPDRAAEIAASELAATVSADSVPDVARVLRRDWLELVRTAKCRAIILPTPIANKPSVVPTYLNLMPNEVKRQQTRLREAAPLFGRYPEVETARSDHGRFAPDVPFGSWLVNYFPQVAQAMRCFHRSWHMSEKLDYLSGKLPAPTYSLHSELVSTLCRYTASLFQPHRPIQHKAYLVSASRYEPLIRATPISRLIYGY